MSKWKYFIEEPNPELSYGNLIRVEDASPSFWKGWAKEMIALLERQIALLKEENKGVKE